MQIKRIMNKIKKEIPDFTDITYSDNTIFFNVKNIDSIELIIIAKIFKDFHVRVKSISCSGCRLSFDIEDD